MNEMFHHDFNPEFLWRFNANNPDAIPFPLCFMWDGTGWKKLSLNTLALRNVFSAQTALNLWIFGLASGKDDKAGTTAALGPNRAVINAIAATKGKTPIERSRRTAWSCRC